MGSEVSMEQLEYAERWSDIFDECGDCCGDCCTCKKNNTSEKISNILESIDYVFNQLDE